MNIDQWLKPPRLFLALSLGITLILASALIWLGLRFLQLDQELQSQRINEHLDSVADRITAEFAEALSETESQLDELSQYSRDHLEEQLFSDSILVAEDGLLLYLTADGLRAFPGNRLIYLPYTPAFESISEGVFARAELEEFQRENFLRAAEYYRERISSDDPLVCAAALLGMGRAFRKAGRYQEALSAFSQLIEYGGLPVNSLPAELIGTYSRCLILDELGMDQELQGEALVLYSKLLNGHWKTGEDLHDFYCSRARDWYLRDGDLAALSSPESEATYQTRKSLAEAVSVIWQEHERFLRNQREGDEGWHILQPTDLPYLSIVKPAVDQTLVFIAGPETIKLIFMENVQSLLDRQGVCIRLTDKTGKEVLTQFSQDVKPGIVRTSGETQLPWTLQLASVDPGIALKEFEARNRLLIIGLVLVVALVIVGSFLITRTILHELRVARLQSDFVAAVSHEFRSPLTTIRQLSEMLARGRVESPERQDKYYHVLLREGERLHRLVEDLLDFGRMESKTMGYEMGMLDAVALVQKIVREFNVEVSDLGYRVNLSDMKTPVMIQADQEALGRALWNLLDNAVKYSPGSKVIWVELNRNEKDMKLSVRDQGLGIPQNEQEAIFDKFFRGYASRQTHKGGTGIGLAMVKQIIEAHNGAISLVSEQGIGSTFTITLPVED